MEKMDNVIKENKINFQINLKYYLNKMMYYTKEIRPRIIMPKSKEIVFKK